MRPKPWVPSGKRTKGLKMNQLQDMTKRDITSSFHVWCFNQYGLRQETEVIVRSLQVGFKKYMTTYLRYLKSNQHWNPQTVLTRKIVHCGDGTNGYSTWILQVLETLPRLVFINFSSQELYVRSMLSGIKIARYELKY